MTSLTGRIAGAPASWGICELPGWGYQLPAELVLAEMRDLGLRATELGPDDFLPGGADERASLLASFGLTALGAFCPLILHDPADAPDEQAREVLDAFDVLGARLMVIAAATGTMTYDERPRLDEDGWTTLIHALERLADMAADRGVTACIHPHMGTMIETPAEVERVLSHSSVPLCLDTGHLTVGGSDPVELARTVPHRIAHVHLKDVDARLAADVRSGRVGYADAVRDGMYTTLGEGDVDLREIVRSLENAGYAGWYVPELDRMLPAAPTDGGPVVDVRASIEALLSVV